jgi:hypothetical protein
LAPYRRKKPEATDNGNRTHSELPETTPERSQLMGDRKGKKDKAKEKRQKAAKQAEAAKRKRDRQQPGTP